MSQSDSGGKITPEERLFGKRLEAEWRTGISRDIPNTEAALQEAVLKAIDKKMAELARQVSEAQMQQIKKTPPPQPDRPFNETLKQGEDRMKNKYQRPMSTREKVKAARAIVEDRPKGPSRFRKFLARLGGHRG